MSRQSCSGVRGRMFRWMWFIMGLIAVDSFALTYTRVPLEDAYIRDGAYVDTACGETDNGSLYVIAGYTGYTRRSYLRFDLRGVNGAVASATLRMKVRRQDAGARNNLRLIDDNSWQEETLTWNNAPGIGTSIATKDVPVAGEWIEWDVTDQISTMVSNQAFYGSFALLASSTAYGKLSVYYSAEYDSEYSPELIVEFEPEYTAPYTSSVFQPVMSDCNLQAPKSSPGAIYNGHFTNYSDWFFYLEDSLLNMTMSGTDNRCELRGNDEFRIDTTEARELMATLKVLYPDTETLEEFTFVQIIASDTINGPLLRLNWKRDRLGVEDHLWANLRTDYPDVEAVVIDLGPRPTGFFDVIVSVQNGKLTVTIDGVTHSDLDERDVSFYDLSNAYKAGVYLQGSGTGHVQFSDLLF